MKKLNHATIGLALLIASIIWIFFRALPFINYRYAHAELTETQLQLYMLSSLRWDDLIPAALAVCGFVLIWKSESK